MQKLEDQCLIAKVPIFLKVLQFPSSTVLSHLTGNNQLYQNTQVRRIKANITSINFKVAISRRTFLVEIKNNILTHRLQEYPISQ